MVNLVKHTCLIIVATWKSGSADLKANCRNIKHILTSQHAFMERLNHCVIIEVLCIFLLHSNFIVHFNLLCVNQHADYQLALCWNKRHKNTHVLKHGKVKHVDDYCCVRCKEVNHVDGVERLQQFSLRIGRMCNVLINSAILVIQLRQGVELKKHLEQEWDVRGQNSGSWLNLDVQRCVI